MSARDQMIASIATVIGVFAFAWGAWWLLRRCRRLGSLMDDGDGQGGVPPLPRRARPADRPGLVHPAFEDWLAARAPVRRDPLDGIVVSAEFERIAAQLHYDSVRDMLDDGDDAA